MYKVKVFHFDFGGVVPFVCAVSFSAFYVFIQEIFFVSTGFLCVVREAHWAGAGGVVGTVGMALHLQVH